MSLETQEVPPAIYTVNELLIGMVDAAGPFVRLGKPIHTQVSSKLTIQEAIGRILHNSSKAHFWNPYAPRADFMMHTDGIFAEVLLCTFMSDTCTDSE